MHLLEFQTTAKRPCFVLISNEELEKNTKLAKNKNTECNEKHAHSAFTKYLEESGLENDDLHYWNFCDGMLDNYLAKFWFGARKDTVDFSDNGDDFEDDPAMKKRDTTVQIHFITLGMH